MKFISKILFILIFLVNASLQDTYNIYVDYLSGCSIGYENKICVTSIENASLMLPNGSTDTYFIIISIDNTIKVPLSLGNIYNFCGRIAIKGDTPIIIDGSNANQPFISVIQEERNLVSCSRFIFLQNSVSFINWVNYSLVEVVTDILEGSSLKITIQSSISKSGNVVYAVPKNNITEKALQIEISGTLDDMVSPTKKVPGSSVDYLSSIHSVGGSLNFPNSLQIINSNLELSPFLYLKHGGANLGGLYKNSNFKNGHPVFMFFSSTIDLPFPAIMNTCNFSTLIYTDNSSIYSSNSVSFSFENCTISGHESHANTSYLGNFYENALYVYKNAVGMTRNLRTDQDEGTLYSNITFYFLENSFFNTSGDTVIVYMGTLDYLSYVKNSSFFITQPNFFEIKRPIVGLDSSIYLDSTILTSLKFNNETFCGCNNCSYYSLENQTEKISAPSSYSCLTPTETPTETPTPTSGLSEQPPTTPPPTSPGPDSSSSSTELIGDSGNATKNIIIIVTILGSASLVTLTAFSIYFRKQKSKRYLLNSINNSNSTSGDGDLTAAAAADNDVSPNLEGTVVYDEDEDCAQLEKL